MYERCGPHPRAGRTAAVEEITALWQELTTHLRIDGKE